MSLGNCKLKQQLDNYYIHVRMAKTPMASVVRMWSNRNSHLLLVGMQNGTVILEDSLTVSYKDK